jgi:DnaJ-class molecular chaperone
MERTYYEILGVEKDATSDEIRAAYKEIARVYHPDSNFYDEIIDIALPPESMDKFKLITSAYNTLVNDDKRRAYNETLPPELADWSTDFGEIDSSWLDRKTRTSGVYAMGQFGNVEKGAHKAAHRDIQEETKVFTRDESFSYPGGELSTRTPWYRKLFSRLVSIVR